METKDNAQGGCMETKDNAQGPAWKLKTMHRGLHGN